jgi:hypothetical protein
MSKGIGFILMNFAVACYLFATGILGFTKNNDGEIRKALTAVLGKGDFTSVLITIVSVLAIAAGILILIRLFNIDVPMIDLILVILAIVWIIFIIMFDVVAPINKSFVKPTFIEWVIPFSSHLMVLSGIALATERFGGR